MKGYRFVKDLTSDVMFEATGKDLKQLFEHAGLALYDVVCQRERVRPERHVEVVVEGRDAKELLHNWLQALIAEVDVRQMFFSKVEVVNITATRLSAMLYGEDMTPAKGKTVVKAVTNYGFALEKTKDGYVARASLDV